MIIKFQLSKYKEESGTSLLHFLMDKGAFGEGLIFFELEKLSKPTKILTNIYLPTEEGTTELDLICITTSGIYVIESKNYSGWIFGSLNSKYWTSMIHGKKYKFFNPIWQNKKHIKYLQVLFPEREITSLIVFSERCEFKKLSIGKNIVIKRRQLKRTLRNHQSTTIISEEIINQIYTILKKYSNQSQEVKQQHIQKIQKKY